MNSRSQTKSNASGFLGSQRMLCDSYSSPEICWKLLAWKEKLDEKLPLGRSCWGGVFQFILSLPARLSVCHWKVICLFIFFTLINLVLKHCSLWVYFRMHALRKKQGIFTLVSHEPYHNCVHAAYMLWSLLHLGTESDSILVKTLINKYSIIFQWIGPGVFMWCLQFFWRKTFYKCKVTFESKLNTAEIRGKL